MPTAYIARTTGVQLINVERSGHDSNGGWVEARIWRPASRSWSRPQKIYGRARNTEAEAKADFANKRLEARRRQAETRERNRAK